MKAVFSWISVILLAVSGAGAFWGGSRLMALPDGSSLHLPPELLKYTPFPDFYIPAVLFILSVGVPDALAVVMTLFRSAFFPKYIQAAGLMLTVWMLVMMVLITHIHPLQYAVLALGLAQLLCGIIVDRPRDEPG